MRKRRRRRRRRSRHDTRSLRESLLKKLDEERPKLQRLDSKELWKVGAVASLAASIVQPPSKSALAASATTTRLRAF